MWLDAIVSAHSGDCQAKLLSEYRFRDGPPCVVKVAV
jgi:hypothetical protein